MSNPKFNSEDFQGAPEISVKKGSCLIYRGEASQKIAYFIVSGSVEVKTECVDGTQLLLYKLGAGELFGELVFMGVTERTASVYAVENATLIKINENSWQKCMQNPAFLKKVYDILLHRFIETTEVVNRLGQSTVLHRLCIYLVSLPEWRQSDADVIRVTLPSNAKLATMVNCTRERMSAVMRHFYKSGVIEKVGSDGEVLLSHSRLLEMTTG
ncbi:Crp/Fnr family transcriptional regulator [Mariprofundus sp. NF]|uniref:Crp/Fnr family transcriptional regulator n=1 Tax=Mariprofundus sp. NF TaxID=2608716 RepID=UPI0015A3830D|nr:Crp/Fnr family transcriptional regulator [Mariprofundus sp. NF]